VEISNVILLDVIYMITDENNITTIDELCGFLTENIDLKITVKKSI
jgi:hypothetical protein